MIALRVSKQMIKESGLPHITFYPMSMQFF